MALQKSLFGPDAPAGAATAVAVAGKAQALTREQKQFNTLIARVAAARHELARWHAFADEMRRRQASEVTPLLARMREQRKLMVALYDRVMAGTQLTERERLKLADILCEVLGQLLEEYAEPELAALYNKYSSVSYEDGQAAETALMADVASEMFGVKLGKDDITGAPEEFAQRVAQKVDEAKLAREARRAARARKKNPKAAAREEQREAAREQAQKNITQSVREVYRKLASELHPDREPDAAERARKTALMQQVNKAYEDGDLLTLLELQLELEQINPDGLANMARDRLLRFNAVLAEQLQRVREEISEITAPYVMAMDVYSARGVTPATVRESFEVEMAGLREGLRSIENDLHDHQDTKKLKQALRTYKIGSIARSAADEFSELDELLAQAVAGFPGAPAPRRGPARGKRRRR